MSPDGRLMQVTVVDACLRDGHGGSPTAVVPDGPLSDAERRAIPRLVGTSHVAFISAEPDHDGAPRAALRFFTATGELPGCGHGTVAALAVLAQRSGDGEFRGSVSAGGRSFAGQARRDGADQLAAFDPGPVELREATTDERELVLDALGHDSGILAAEVCVASVGRPRLLVPVIGKETLAGLRPDHDRLRSGCDRLGLLGAYVYSAPDSGGRLSARMFAPSIGVPEDIANANSTGCLAAHLLGQGINELSVDMGDALGRPATVLATARETGAGIEIRAGGAARVARTLALDRRDLARASAPPSIPWQPRETIEGRSERKRG